MRNNEATSTGDTIRKRKPIVSKKLSEVVTEELEEMIRREEFKEGESLPSERELMDLFGVGRPSIREALSNLRHKGLVKFNKGEKASVCRPSSETIINGLSGVVQDFLSTPEGIEDFEKLRIFFETSLVRYAAVHADEQQIKRLGEVLDVHHNSLKSIERYAYYDIEFHNILAELPRNQILKTVHSALSEWLIMAKPLKKDNHTYASNKQTHQQHLKIYQAICARDPDSAEKLMAEHLQTRLQGNKQEP